MRCPECAADNPDDSKFCSSCGQPIPALSGGMPPIPEESEAEASLYLATDGTLEPKVEGAEAPVEREPFGDSFPGPPSRMEASRKEPAFCSRCGGAFREKELEKVDGELICSLCRDRMESRKSRPKAGAGMFGGGAPGFGDPGAGPVSRIPSTARMKAAEPLSGGKIALFSMVVVFLVAAASVAIFFYLSDTGVESGETTPGPASDHPLDVEKKEPSGTSPPAVEDPVDPKPPSPSRSYEPRWFTGVYKGVYTGEGQGMGTLHFEGEGDEKVLVEAPEGLQSLYATGKTYKFKFIPTDLYYDTGIISYYKHLRSRIEEMD